jgi:HTH-type transcriptional regulator / antitoxin HigA
MRCDVELKLIKTRLDYRAALKLAEKLWDAPESSADADRLDVLTLLIQNYESKHHAIADPDPIEFLQGVMEQRGLSRKDLEPYIGSRARVAEILNRVRPLTLDMIRRLSQELGLPAEVLVRRYEVTNAA